MDGLIISVSGLRGVVGESLTPIVAARYVTAYAKFLHASKRGTGARPLVIVGRDGRASGVLLQRIVVASLEASGCDCLIADVAATPTIGVLVRDRAADGAIQITASHNPPPYNGMKLFGPTGRVVGAATGTAIKEAYEQGGSAWRGVEKIGSADVVDDPHAPHLDAVLATVDVAAIAAKNYRVLLDSNHGAGAALGMRLLVKLGCKVVVIGAEPDGKFEHVPEPTAENLQTIAARVAKEKCDVGFCQDPDADRLALIDAAGRYVGEEYTLALCVQRAMGHTETRGSIVINGATSGMSERLAATAGVTAYRSAVGEANVADMMITNKASYGGEGNGGPIDPRVGYVRDSFVGMAQVLALMTEQDASLGELVDALPRLAIYKTKVTVDAAVLPSAMKRIAENFSDAKADFSDGLRLAWPDRWLLVRGSNTEPIVRLIAEAATDAEAKRLCEQAAVCIDKSGMNGFKANGLV